MSLRGAPVCGRDFLWGCSVALNAGKGLRLRSLKMSEREVGRGEIARHTGREKDPGRKGTRCKWSLWTPCPILDTTSFHCSPGACTCPALFCELSLLFLASVCPAQETRVRASWSFPAPWAANPPRIPAVLCRHDLSPRPGSSTPRLFTLAQRKVDHVAPSACQPSELSASGRG